MKKRKKRKDERMSEKFNYGMSLEPYNLKVAMKAARELLEIMDNQKFIDDPRPIDIKSEFLKHVKKKHT